MPNNFTTNGTPGMAILFHHLTGLSVSTMVIAINISLLIWGAQYIGKQFAIKTVIYIFQDVEKAMWSIISIYATSKAIDVVLKGDINH